MFSQFAHDETNLLRFDDQALNGPNALRNLSHALSPHNHKANAAQTCRHNRVIKLQLM